MNMIIWIIQLTNYKLDTLWIGMNSHLDGFWIKDLNFQKLQFVL